MDHLIFCFPREFGAHPCTRIFSIVMAVTGPRKFSFSRRTLLWLPMSIFQSLILELAKIQAESANHCFANFLGSPARTTLVPGIILLYYTVVLYCRYYWYCCATVVVYWLYLQACGQRARANEKNSRCTTPQYSRYTFVTVSDHWHSPALLHAVSTAQL